LDTVRHILRLVQRKTGKSLAEGKNMNDSMKDQGWKPIVGSVEASLAKEEDVDTQ
jgi:hypothetical protein